MHRHTVSHALSVPDAMTQQQPFTDGTHVDRLPTELKQAIYARLERDDFIRMSQTNRSWRHASACSYVLTQQLTRRGLAQPHDASDPAPLAFGQPGALRAQLLADHPYRKTSRRHLQMAGLGAISELGLSMDNRLLTASESSRAYTCSLDHLDCPSTHLSGLYGGVERATLASDGKAAVLQTYAGACMAWDLADVCAPLGRKDGRPSQNASSTACDGRRLFLGRSDGRVERYGPHTWPTEWQAHPAAVTAVGCAASSPLIGTADVLGVAKLWREDVDQLCDERVDHTLLASCQAHTGAITTACLSADAQWMLTGSDDASACLWRFKNGALTMASRVMHHSPVHTVCFSAQSRLWASVSQDAVVRIARVDRLDAPILQLEGHTDFIHSVRFAPNQRFVLTSSEDGTARLWDLSQIPISHALVDVRSAAINCTAISSDGQYVATGGDDGLVSVFAYALEDGGCAQHTSD